MKRLATLLAFLASTLAFGQTGPKPTGAKDGGAAIPIGSVTSINCSTNLATVMDKTGCPITTNGTIGDLWATQSANQVLAGPLSGAAALPGFRSLTSDDFIAWGIPFSIGKASTLVTVTNVSEVVIYSVQIPANALGTTGVMETRLFGDLLYNDTDATRTLQIKIKYGCADGTTAACGAGQVIYDSGAKNQAGAINATRAAWTMSFAIHEKGTTASQIFDGWFGGSDRQGATVGLADLDADLSASPAYRSFINSTGTTVSSAAASYLMVTAQLSHNSANLDFRLFGGYTLVMP